MVKSRLRTRSSYTTQLSKGKKGTGYVFGEDLFFSVNKYNKFDNTTSSFVSIIIVKTSFACCPIQNFIQIHNLINVLLGRKRRGSMLRAREIFFLMNLLFLLIMLDVFANFNVTSRYRCSRSTINSCNSSGSREASCFLFLLLAGSLIHLDI